MEVWDWGTGEEVDGWMDGWINGGSDGKDGEVCWLRRCSQHPSKKPVDHSQAAVRSTG